MDPIRWFRLDRLPVPSGMNWARSVAINGAGRVFAPAALFGKEAELYQMARSRLAPAIQMDGHLFLPTSFLGEMVPEKKNLAEAIRMVTRSVAGMSLDGEDVVPMIRVPPTS